MKQMVLIIGITLALLLNGCSQSAEDKAKIEFKETMLSIKPENFLKEWTKVKKGYEDKYGMQVNVWFEELKETNEWQALRLKAINQTRGKVPKF